MAIRVWVLWEKRRDIGILLCLISIANTTVCIVTVFISVPPFTFPVIDGLISAPSACFFGHDMTVIAPYIALIVQQTFIFVLTAIKGVQHYRTGVSGASLVNTLYNDGIIYYALAIVPSIAIITMASLENKQTYASPGIDIQPVILSVLSSRLSLHLHQQADISRRGTLQLTTEIQFAAGEGLNYPS
ncbi:hypothetical protein BDZ94DRAFT_1254178 [Collybia nuda]|uniref:Uncharacterized protein n=1 Tax=Collybia nuda TaxID=64659 RepID=A0A9P5Y8H1_9AGAR|nr:hypothetical protein BDZ94DRAFT_1254178 [Collybia nuda]